MQSIKNKNNRRILVIDDNKAIHDDFRDILGDSSTDTTKLDKTKAAIFGDTPNSSPECFEIDSAFQGEEGLEKIIQADREGRPYVMAFVDIRMPPGWDGIETIQKIWRQYQDLQIVICTAHSDYSWHDMIEQLGQTDRLLILKKPFDNIEVRQLACSLTKKWDLLNNLDQLVKQRTEQITETRDIAVFAMASLAESRDPETGEHLERIRNYCQILAEELSQNSPYKKEIGKHFLEDLYRSSPLHDIGKVGIPDKILLKPASLTESEFKIMKQHSVIGADALDKTVRLAKSGGFLAMAADIARYHHERFDGNGYPTALAGHEIPLHARIVALADVYDALTTSRVYKPAFRPEVARLIIEEEKGQHFDPVIVEAYMDRIDDFIKVLQKSLPEMALVESTP
jgi:putative two-component system response regulator